MSYDKHKDAPPKVTIELAKSIYNELGLDIDITVSKKIDGIYSSLLVDKNGGWVTCGKGTTEEYCIASACGESIEHLCNYTAYDMSNLSKEAREYGGFFFYPDEQQIAITELISASPDIIDDAKKACSDGDLLMPDEEIEAFLTSYFGSSSLACVPFYSVKNQTCVPIPTDLLLNLCGSNGGGAGNTPEEAIGHALDEIAERYCKEQIYHRHLTPPIIPDSFIKERCPELLHVITELREEYGFNILVKDATLGIGLPVVCVVLIDPQKQEYIANFGAHPCFEIALERCLTEMFQMGGNDHDKVVRKSKAKWKRVSQEYIDGIKNWVSLLKDDVGILPDSMFAGDNSWEFKEWKKYSNYTNHFGMLYEIEHLLKVSDDIYIRNNSCTSFYSYKVYIPGVSTTALTFGKKEIEGLKYIKEFPVWMKERETFTDEQKIHLAKYVFAPDTYLGSLSIHNMNEFLFNDLYAALEYDLGNKERAMQILCEQGDARSECAMRALQLMEDGISGEHAEKLLFLFYPSDIAEFGSCWLETFVFEEIINKYVRDKYRNVVKGQVSRHQDKLDELHIRIKKRMEQYLGNQMMTRELVKE